MLSRTEIFGYAPKKEYSKSVAYFSMEFAIDQSLKIYSGGLGFLAGSHMRSAFELKQNLVGIGMLWKYGYYDQVRSINGAMKADYVQKYYSFLTDTGIVFPVEVHSAIVYVKAYLLKPEVFGTAPIFLLSTDIEQNDNISRTITNRLYDANESTRIAQSIVLGIGGAKLMEILDMGTEIYHMNEGHAVPLCFYLYSKFKNIDEVRRRVVFTTHTPEEAGNEQRSFELLSKMSFFNGLSDDEVRKVAGIEGNSLNYTLTALRFAKIANGVSKMHGEVSREMWSGFSDICEITSITNAQNKKYWKDDALEKAMEENDDKALATRKKEMKKDLFKIVADQTGKIFDEDVLTLVWARRYAGYKRADLIASDVERFAKLIKNSELPIQIIWAGKPYPEDYTAIDTFNHLFQKTLANPNIAVLTGYELGLSAALKKGSDVWLNNPRLYREASGTSGMTAAMNGSVNFSIPDGWIPEFAKHGVNSFIIEPADRNLPQAEQDSIECSRLMDILEKEILPMYYSKPKSWANIVKNGMRDVAPAFESGRMAKEYYTLLFNMKVAEVAELA
ncbi:MAG TPA: alpha-glucan family phosphorylase [Saprospiraceae bacterium]|nr:alpha-glucan family phosphorylase [Saprospiraceae bacterium]HQV65306.1 alpha-glucan family phosphorylase [Saprospiraceae bacterium]